jgi:hypothetical protein
MHLFGFIIKSFLASLGTDDQIRVECIGRIFRAFDKNRFRFYTFERYKVKYSVFDCGLVCIATRRVLLECYTYLLATWSTVLLEKLTGFAASQEIPHIYGTPKFINILTSARHLSLS